MSAVFSYDAQTGPIYIDINGIAAGYGVLSVPVAGFVPGDVVQTVALTIQGTGLSTIALAVDMVQRTGGFYEWTDQSSIDAHFTLTPAQIAAINAATGCTYSVTIMILRNGVQQIRQVQAGAVSAEPQFPLSPLVVNSIVLTGGPVSGGIGAQAQLTATCYDGFGNLLPSATVIWTSSNNNVASVDVTGKVTFLLPGAVTISATSQGTAASTTATCFDNSYTSPTDKEVSAYSAGQSKWLPTILTAAFLSLSAGALVVGGGWPTGASELAPGAAAGYVRSNGSAWVRQTGVPAADVTPGSFEAGLYTFPNGLAVTGGLSVTGGITGALTNALTFGTHLTGSSYNNSSGVTIGVDATNANTPSTMVARDGSGNFAAGTITATLAGNASTATLAALASTATKLAASVTINGVAFDGSSNITVTADATTLTGAALNGAVAVGLSQVTGLISGGKISPGLMPPLAISETFTVANQAAMLALAAGQGDIALRTDISTTFILSGTDPTILSNWTQLLVPPNAVLSVAGKTGVVTLVSADIGDAVATNTANRLVLRDSVGSFSANIITASLAGNAATATQFQTSRTINGVTYDGTASVTITAAAGTLTGSTLAAGVTSSSLTGVGTIATGVWQGTAIADTFLATIATAGKVANSATTAVATNTPSSIVLRDVSGNFAAASITAASITASAVTVPGAVLQTGTVTARFENTAAAAPGGSAGAGLELYGRYLTGSKILSFNRTSLADTPLAFEASAFTFEIGGVTMQALTATTGSFSSTLTVAAATTIQSGGLTITAGGLVVSASGIDVTGLATFHTGASITGTTAVQSLTAANSLVMASTAPIQWTNASQQIVGSVATGHIAYTATSHDFTGPIAAAGGVQVTGGSSAAGELYKSSVSGLVITAIAGSASDLVLAGPSGANILTVPTGTVNIVLAGNLAITALANVTRSSPAGLLGYYQVTRGATPLYYIGQDAGDRGAILNSAANAANMWWTDAGDFAVAASFTATTSLGTGNPAGGTAKPWKFGSRVAATVALVTSQYIELDVNGTLFKLATVS